MIRLIIALYLIPTVVLFVSVIVYFVIKMGLNSYFDNMKYKVDKLGEILRISFTKELLRFFSNSNASDTAQILSENMANRKIDNVSTLTTTSLNAMRDVNQLYRKMKDSFEPDLNYSRIKQSFQLLTRIVIVYGLSISFLMYLLVVFISINSADNYGKDFALIILGGTVIFSMILVMIILDIMKYTNRIEKIISKENEEWMKL
ncbi:hypothetical protein OXIME_001039 [Oxyplasma meridianum]|uniref:DUF2721 domain-containing protein n=1 Tax=Oxyplasma meridianum TaxID=3073602 RepID=A0AAX4NH16_9ARCH